MYEFYFEKLEVLKNARILNSNVYLLTNKFPKEELFGLASQLRWFTSSISANIAEGMSRETSKEKKRFLNIAYASAVEVINFFEFEFRFRILG